MWNCPRCGDGVLEIDNWPTTDTLVEDELISLKAWCHKCGFKGEINFDLVFRNFWDAKTEENLEG